MPLVRFVSAFDADRVERAKERKVSFSPIRPVEAESFSEPKTQRGIHSDFFSSSKSFLP